MKGWTSRPNVDIILTCARKVWIKTPIAVSGVRFEPGTFQLKSGKEDNCQKNQKTAILVSLYVHKNQ
jgi:hypothetical protein